MNRHAFRSVTSRRSRPELEYATQTLSCYFRQFTTSTSRLADESSSNDNNNTSQPKTGSFDSLRREQNARAMAGIKELVNKGPDAAPTQKAAPEGAAPNASKPRIVDVKSLPRGGLRGRGGMRGRGGARGGFGGFGANAARGAPGGFQGRGRGRGGAMRGGRGRGQSSSGPQRGRRRQKKKDGEEDEEEDNRRRPWEDEPLSPAHQAFNQEMRFGVETIYKPSLTMESLAQHMPVVAASSGSRAAAIHQDLASLGTADRVGRPAEMPPTLHADHFEKHPLRYFADVRSKERTNEYLEEKRQTEAEADPSKAQEQAEPIIKDAEESIRKAIMDAAVKGQHDAPKFGTDPATIAHNWHLRSETWTSKEVAAFDNKLSAMLNKGKAGGKQAAKK